MAKLTLTDIGSRYGSIDALNANFAAIELAMENTFSLDGTGPNGLEATLDANSQRIINLPTPVGDSDAATKTYVDSVTAVILQYVDDIVIVADNIASVQTVAGISANVTTVAGIAANVTTVAGVAANVTTVAGISSDVTAVVGDAVDIGLVASSIANINTTATNIANVNTVAGISANVTTVAGIDTEVTALAGLQAEIEALYAELDNIATKVSKTSDTGSARIPVGTTAQRDGTPATGYLRYNASYASFEGYSGSSWGSVGGGATGGGADAIFVENDQTVTTDYTITTNKNAASTGPITVNSGVSVTVPTGSRWVIS